jgi:hypothetical protein
MRASGDSPHIAIERTVAGGSYPLLALLGVFLIALALATHLPVWLSLLLVAGLTAGWWRWVERRAPGAAGVLAVREDGLYVEVSGARQIVAFADVVHAYAGPIDATWARLVVITRSGAVDAVLPRGEASEILSSCAAPRRSGPRASRICAPRRRRWCPACSRGSAPSCWSRWPPWCCATGAFPGAGGVVIAGALAFFTLIFGPRASSSCAPASRSTASSCAAAPPPTSGSSPSPSRGCMSSARLETAAARSGS